MTTARLDDIDGPSDVDLTIIDVEVGIQSSDDLDLEALLEPVVKVTQREADDFWADEPEDDRYGTEGIPSWSVWA